MQNMHTKWQWVLIWLMTWTVTGHAEVEVVSTRQAFIKALSQAEPGTIIQLAPGTYESEIEIKDLKGTAAAPIVLMAQDPGNRPLFKGGRFGLHLIRCDYVILRKLRVTGASSNGINIDDGGNTRSPAHHIMLDNLDVSETGPTGNRDGIKLSGLDYFLVRNCRVTGWGGSAIDMVGCRRGVVEGCHFEGREGFSQSNALQMKGGSRDLMVVGNTFRDVGHRSINIGGHTGLPFFRPSAGDYEATRIEVAGNEFHGSIAPIAWATAKGGYVHHNDFLYPEKWVMRILQENDQPSFAPSQGGRFENNVIIYDRRVSVQVNIGPGTAPETFLFRNNYWQSPSQRPPNLPTPELGGEHASHPSTLELGQILHEQSKKGRGAKSHKRKMIPADDFQSPEWQQIWGQ